MSMPIKLKFSDTYTQAHGQGSLQTQKQGFWRRLSHARDQQMARQALAAAGEPGLVLDLPSGTGRFWPLLAEQPNRIIVGADNAGDRLATATQVQPHEVVSRVRTLQTSAFAIDLPEHAVDCIFSMRLLHHVGTAEHRLAMLKEFHRVTRDTVIVSLWVDGNYKAWRRKRLEAKRANSPDKTGEPNRFVIRRAVIEAEFKQAGFVIDDHIDFIPLFAMWRVYVLRAVDKPAGG